MPPVISSSNEVRVLFFDTAMELSDLGLDARRGGGGIGDVGLLAICFPAGFFFFS